MRFPTVIPTLALALTASLCTSFAQMTVMNGASYNTGQPHAPGSFVTVFGQNLCSQTATAQLTDTGDLPTTLGTCSVRVNGVPARLNYASPGQINFVMPMNVNPGDGTLAIQNGSQAQSGPIAVGVAGPGVFAMNGMGVGDGAVLHATKWKAGPFSVTTDGQPTPLAIFLTGMDLTTKPTVMIGGMAADVTWFGQTPGSPGLQQINITLTPEMAGAGRVPLSVISGGETSNITYVNILPTTAMMRGMPGWGNDKDVQENESRGADLSALAFNPVNSTALVADEDDDVVRVISLVSKSTVATITLPSGSQPHDIAVNPAGTLAAVALSAQASVALIDLAQNKVSALIGTAYYPSHLVFWGTNLLVSNGAHASVSIIDTATNTVTRDIPVGFGPSGIDVFGNTAVVANMQGGTLSIINLGDYSVTAVNLPAGARPKDVAIATLVNKAVITDPTLNAVYLLDLTSKAVTPVDPGSFNLIGPGPVAVNGALAFVGGQMNAGVAVVDLNAAKVIKTFTVDPGPRALAVNQAKNQLLALCEGAGTLDVVDLTSYSIVDRIDAGDTRSEETWTIPVIASITPASGKVNTTVTLTITGTGLQGVHDLEFNVVPGRARGRGGMNGMGREDEDIKVTNVQANPDGTQLTATVQILQSAEPGVRHIRLETDRGEVMGPSFSPVFTVTQ